MAQDPTKVEESSQKPLPIFAKDEIIPDVVSCEPQQLLQVQFGKKDISAGDELTKSEASVAPSIKFNGEKDVYYTLVVSDPDAPSRKNPFFGEWLHWLVVNIPGESPTADKGNMILEYNGPAPPKGTGSHRYALLVFKQNKKLNKSKNEWIADGKKSSMFNFMVRERARFCVKDFLKSNKDGLSDLVAGNYFVTRA